MIWHVQFSHRVHPSRLSASQCRCHLPQACCWWRWRTTTSQLVISRCPVSMNFAFLFVYWFQMIINSCRARSGGMWRKQSTGLPLPPFLFSPPHSPLHFPSPSSFLFPSLSSPPLRSRPILIQQGVQGSNVSEVWGALAMNAFFWYNLCLGNTSWCNSFNDFPNNQLFLHTLLLVNKRAH